MTAESGTNAKPDRQADSAVAAAGMTTSCLYNCSTTGPGAARGHDVGPGHAKVSWTPCGCGPALEANERGRGLGHITVTCSMCWIERRVTRFFEPPHDTRHPMAHLGQAPARADPEAIRAWIEEGQAREGRRAHADVVGRARQVTVPLFNPRSPCGLRPAWSISSSSSWGFSRACALAVRRQSRPWLSCGPTRPAIAAPLRGPQL